MFIAPDGKLGAMVEVNCETDFVAKNEEFLAFARSLAELVARQTPGGRRGAVGAAAGRSDRRRGAHGAGRQDRREHVASAASRASRRKGRLASYVHGGAKIGVLVDVAGGDEALAKDIAMHIAASKPVALSRAEVPAELIEKEREIARPKAAESGKPANIVEKMVEGSVQKFLKEVTLLGQPFVKNDKQTRRAAAQVEGRAGAALRALRGRARASRRSRRISSPK